MSFPPRGIQKQIIDFDGASGSEEQFEASKEELATAVRELAGHRPIIVLFASAQVLRLPWWIDWLLGRLYRWWLYRLADKIGELIARSGACLLTGACPGLVELVEKAFRKYRQAGQFCIGIHKNGLNTEQKPSRWCDFVIDCRTFGNRLGLMLLIGDGAIALPGGIGTLLEIVWFLQHSQRTGLKRHLCLPTLYWWALKPVIWMMLLCGAVRKHELGYLHFCGAHEALRVIHENR